MLGKIKILLLRKGILVGVLLVAVAFLMTGNLSGYKAKAFFASSSGQTPLAGDYNGDNVVDLNDAMIVLRTLVQGGSTSDMIRHDVNYDKKIGLGDIIYVLQATAGLRGYMAASGGAEHTIALLRGGTVRTWGSNGYGQLGDGDLSALPGRNIPSAVGGLSKITTVATGGYHSLALKNNGTVLAWGYNYDGQLGDNTHTNRNAPISVTGIDGVVAIAGGFSHSVALKNDGTVWTWGWNEYRQLGIGTNISQPVPTKVSGDGFSDIVAVAAGEYHTVALKGDGTVWTWGDNSFGQLGMEKSSVAYPEQVPGLIGVRAISAGRFHTAALKYDGTVWTWGDNTYGQLGYCTKTGNCYNSGFTPTQIILSRDYIVAVAAGDGHTVALSRDGKVWTWGDNAFGQLGDGKNTGRITPEKIIGLDKIVAVAAGYYHTIALRSDGTLRTWGHNGSGELGDGTNVHRNTPTPVGHP